MREILAVSNLGKSYQQRIAVDQVSLSLNEGEAVGLLGANGAGKSTLIKCIMGLVRADAGQVDHPFQPPAYLPELPQLPVSLSALSLLQYKCSATGLKSATAEQILTAVNLASDAHRQPINQYSKGMRQRVALALALCGDPKLICLDEPMSGLDALGRAEILGLLKQRKSQGTAFLMSSHIVSDMVQLCDRVLVMAHGNIHEEVPIQEHSLSEARKLEEKLAYWTAKR